MSSLSDTLTIGVVLVLLFGSIALYLYTRIQQAEQKVNLLESILLDVKMSAEIKSYSDLPADTEEQTPHPSPNCPAGPSEAVSTEEYTMLDDLEKQEPQESVYLQMEDTEQETEQEQGQGQEQGQEQVQEIELTSDAADSSDLLLHAAPLVSYENMTLKDLQTLAKSRHITGVSTMKKGALVDALKASQLDAFVVEELVA
jgi:hypothetical protein